MPEKIKPELLKFLQPGELPLHILVVESLSYLPKLRQMFPAAKLYAVTADRDAMLDYAGLSIEFSEVNYLAEPLPYDREMFDYIISDLTLEQAGHPQDIAAGFSRYLKETGSFLTSFRNIRHWTQLQDLLAGHYYNVVARLFARQEFERLLYASYYKMVFMEPQKRAAEEKTLQRLLAAGFCNDDDDINVEFYLVRADRSMPEMALLKSMYTKEERRQLSIYLHRIEYDVEADKNCREFWKLYREKGFFADYTAAFIKQAVFHPVNFYRQLMAHSLAELAEVGQMLQGALHNVTSEEEAAYLQELRQEWQGKQNG
ncbi:MAG: class I SAM-dependent methyltransferase [Selenomonas sp.]|uniref:class I SAM-dependent methyltransferase n=1 Tax=Selenomonas sp. TaxID=2053611 RepID=UPI0026009F72|nr:class I SAM-dependent methyltransferase [Selenomonas sp.]MCR5756561.1 class I SAM-dependent methyltransferase [Selenomonas sp.]